MKLNFPNPSRSFEETSNRVLFWGYDNVIEVSFFVEAEALEKLSPAIGGTEAGFLEAFDSARKRIYEVAENAYVHGSKGSFAYILAAKDF